MRLAPLFVLVLAAACGGKTTEPAVPAAPPATAAPVEPAPAEPQPAATPEHLPPPFTAAELQAGLPVGTEMKFRIEAAGAEPIVQHWVVTGNDLVGGTIHARILTPDGTLISDEGDGTSSWDELESHAHFPADHSTRTESSVDVAAGHFDTWLFVVEPQAPDEPTRRFHFAKQLPGPPVLMEVEQDGTIITRMELLSRTGP